MTPLLRGPRSHERPRILGRRLPSYLCLRPVSPFGASSSASFRCIGAAVRRARQRSPLCSRLSRFGQLLKQRLVSECTHDRIGEQADLVERLDLLPVADTELTLWSLVRISTGRHARRLPSSISASRPRRGCAPRPGCSGSRQPQWRAPAPLSGRSFCNIIHTVLVSAKSFRAQP